MSNCDCNQGRQPCTCKPLPPAGDVPEYFVAACDKFDWTPEEALRFYAEGKHFDTVDGRTRILCTGAIASHALKGLAGLYADMKGIDPAGDVEVLGWALNDGDEHPIDITLQWGVAKHWPEYATPLVDRSHVTRLTAERDEIRAIKDSAIESVALLHAERYGLLALADRRNSDIAALQSELTKALECISEAGVLLASRWTMPDDLSAWRKSASECLARQPAPAAKGGSDE